MKAITKVGVSWLLLAFLAACSSDTSTEAETNETDDEGTMDDSVVEEEEEPVTVTITTHWDEEMFNERFKTPVEERFPHITLEQIQTGAGREDLEELFAAGELPDIFFELSQVNLEYFELDFDLDELVDMYDYDLSHMNPSILNSMRARDPEQRLLAMPYEIGFHVLFYNKDIFDEFGQPYPTDDMTWDEAIELAQKVTGERNGVHYRGLDFSNPEIAWMQFSINRSDPETGEVLLDQPEFAQYVELIDRVMSIPGNAEGEPFSAEAFAEEHTTAMFTSFVQGLNWWENNEGLNDAIAPLPVWSEDHKYTHRADRNIIGLSINPHSENKKAAFDVITYFTEDEYQLWASQNGIGPSTNDTEILNEFFQAYESTHDKNVASMFNHPPAPPPEEISRWEPYVELDMRRYLESDMDRNEFLRVVAEEAEIAIKEAMASE